MHYPTQRWVGLGLFTDTLLMDTAERVVGEVVGS